MARRPAKKTPARRRKAIARAPIPVPRGWKLERGGRRMSARLATADFMSAVDLVNEIARIAEAINHHPDLHLEKWNRLKITTYSHDVGKLTPRDARLARQINQVIRSRGLRPLA